MFKLSLFVSLLALPMVACLSSAQPATTEATVVESDADSVADPTASDEVTPVADDAAAEAEAEEASTRAGMACADKEATWCGEGLMCEDGQTSGDPALVGKVGTCVDFRYEPPPVLEGHVEINVFPN